MTVALAFDLCIRIAALASLLVSIEVVFSGRRLYGHGLLHWDPLSTDDGLIPKRSAVLSRMMHWPGTRVVAVARVFLSIALLTVGTRTPGVSVGIVTLLSFSLLLSQLRGLYGMDGADQMQLVMFGAAAIGLVFGNLRACLWFWTFQLLLSYGVAGIAKLRARKWRTGEHLTRVMLTNVYGWRPLGLVLSRHPRTARALSWTIIAWECLAFTIPVAPRSVVIVYLAVGICFHLVNAFVMGLNAFLLPFVSPYPAVMALCAFESRY